MKNTAQETIKVVHVLEPDSYAAGAAANSAGIDCQGFDEALIVFDLGDFTATGDVTFQIQESADNVTFTNVTGAAVAEKVQADDEKVYVGRVDLAKRLRYLRVQYDVDDDAVEFAVLALLMNAKYKPVSQENAVAFTV